MPSEFEKLQAELAEQPATATLAEEEPGLLEKTAAVGVNLLNAIPGAKAGMAQVLGQLPGLNPQIIAQRQAELERRNPGASLLGSAASGIAGGALTGGLGGAGMLASAGAAAALQPIYRLGDVVNQAQAQGDPLRIEQIKHALMPDWDTLKAAGIAAAFHIPGLAVEGLSKLQEAAGPAATKAATKLLPKAAQVLGVDPAALGRLMLNKKILQDATKIGKLKDEAASVLKTISAETEVDIPFQEELAQQLDRLVEHHGWNTNLEKPLRKLQEQSAALTNRKLTGGQIEEIIQGLQEKGGRDSQTQELFRDAAQFMRTKFRQHIEVLDPEAGAAYKDAAANHYTYSKLGSEAFEGALQQATGADIGKAIGKRAIGGAIGGALGGPVGAIAGEVAGGMIGSSSLRGKNYAVLLDRFNKSPPLATFLRNSDKVIDTLLGKPSALYGGMSSKKRDLNEYYEEVSDAARGAVSNVEQFAADLGTKLSFLPPHEADPIVASTIDRFQEAAQQLPISQQPPTAFGIQTGPTDRQKRDWLAKFEAKFDPYKAILSGNAEIITEASKHFPETMQEIKKKLIERVSTSKVSYSTMRQISAILGVAGVPTQDPGLAAQLQTVIQDSRAAHSAQGQMDSARQQHAALKNNQATLTRANSLSKGLDEG